MFGRKLIKLSHVISVQFVQPAAKKGNPSESREGKRERERGRKLRKKELKYWKPPNCKRNPNSKLKTKIETN